MPPVEPNVAMIEPVTGRLVRVLQRDRAEYELKGFVLGEREPGADAVKSAVEPREGIEHPADVTMSKAIGREDGEPTEPVVDLNALTVPQLRSLAAEAEIEGASKMNKAALVDALASLPGDPIADPLGEQMPSGAEEGPPAALSAPDTADENSTPRG